MWTDWSHIAGWLSSLGMGVKGMPHIITEAVSLAALGEASPVVKFAENTKFLWTHGMYTSDSATIAAGTDVLHGGASVEIKNPAGRGAMDNGQLWPISTLFGRAGVAGQGPRPLPIPFLFDQHTNLNLRVVNTVNAAQVIKLVFIGVKVG